MFVKSPETKETRLILAPPDKSETSIYELNKSGQLSRLESRSTTAPVGTMLWRQRGWLALFSADKASVELTRFFGRNPQLHVVNVPPDTDNIDLEDITNDNKDDLLVFGKRTVGITVYRGTADGFSSKAISLLPEVSVSDMVITDLNGDLIKDIFVSDWLSNKVVLYLGIGRGIFSEQVSVELPGEPADLALYRDGSKRGRIAVTIPDLRQLQVFTVNALGEFRSEATLRCPGTPTGVRFADVNADGLIDLVTATENELIVFPGGSEQPFREPSVFAAGGVISDWVLTDVDGDDLVDAAIITTNPSKITILGNSSFHGTVDWPSTYGVGRSPRGLTTGDFNGDGRIDAGVVCSVSGTLCLLLNQGEGRMTGPIFAHVASNPISVKAVAEGKGASTTFVLSHYPSTQVTVVQRRDDFRFSSFAIPTAGNPFVLSAEIDRSRHTLSFLTTNRTDEQENISLSLFDEISEDQFIETSLQPSPSKSVTSIASFDMTGDNEMDLVFTTFERNRDQSSVSVSRGIDRSSFSPYEKVFSFPDSAGTVRFIRSAFLDSDSRPDIIAILGKPMACLLLLYGNGTGGIRDSVQWIRDVDIPDGDALIVEDLNNDGNMDLCFIDLQTQRIVALYGKGGGEFGMRKPIHSAEGIVALSVASFLTAPVKDLIISHEANGTISLVRNPF